jgi:hypothetical protein
VSGLKKAVLVQTGVTLIMGAAAFTLGGSQQAVSALIGSSITSVSVGLMMWSLWQVFAKKFIALAGMIIVIKYLLLAAILYWVCSQKWVSLPWLAVGLSSVVVAAIVYGLSHQKEIEE